ncbi:MAG: NAD(P)-binding domain-containing protein [Nitrososphaerota archaeon]
MKVCVLGLGEVGLPTAKYVLSRSLEVWAYDINSIAIERAKKEGIFNATDDWSEVPPTEVYIICVSTLLNGDVPNFSPIYDACEKISKKAQASSLVSIESTVIPGTSRKIYENIFNRSVKLVHVPHRYWAGDPERYGVKQLRVIGAVNEESLNIGLSFYRNILGIPLYVVSSIEIAEMCKIAENAYRYVQIAFSEELKMICEEIGLNFNEVRDACNTKWNIVMHEARSGIGGHCLPKDIRYLASLTKNNILLKSAIFVDQQYRAWLKTLNRK